MAPYSWLPTLLPSNLQKRLLSYALTHILGTFLESQTFSLENLELQLLNGSVTLLHLELNASKLNGLLRLPAVEVINGHIAQVTVQIPVRDVLSGRISVKINGVQILVQPNERRMS
jgi:N-terminal region of Chorein or VPS13